MKYLHQNKYWDLDKDYNIDKILYLMIDRPNEITELCFAWEIISKNNEIQFHRNYDLPLFVSYLKKQLSVNLYWDINGLKHRDNNKPCYIKYNNYKQFYTHGKLIKNENPK